MYKEVVEKGEKRGSEKGVGKPSPPLVMLRSNRRLIFLRHHLACGPRSND